MCGHFLAGAAVDDDCIGGTKTLGGAGHVHGGVAAAVDHHSAPQHRFLLTFHRTQDRDSIKYFCRRTCRDEGTFADMCADGEKGSIETSNFYGVEDVVNFGIELERNPHVEYTLYFSIESFTREAVFWNAETHHSARVWTGIVDRNSMADACQMVGGGQAGRTCADD